MHNQKRAYIYALCAVLLWSTVATAFKISLTHLHYLQLLLYSSATSLLVLFIILLVQGKWDSLCSLPRREILKSAWLGFLNPFLYYIVLFAAYSILTAQEAVTLNYTWPIMLALLSIPLLKQRIGLASILAIFISFTGVVFIATHGDIIAFRSTNPGGAALALGSAIIWAGYWILNLRDRQDGSLRLFLNFGFGFIYILILVLVLPGVNIAADIRGIAGAIYVGLFEMGITFALWLRALKLSATTAKVSNLVYASPFLSLIWISMVLDEKIIPSTLWGLALIITGIVLQRYFTRKGARPSGPGP